MDLHPAVARWFARSFPGGPTEAQRLAIPLIAAGENVLLSSPTGTGKTLAGFLAILSDLFDRAEDGALPSRVDTVYVSPLKALANDVTRNLEAPLRGIEAEMCAKRGTVRHGLRTGETPQHVRARMAANPPHVLVTTPESLALLLLSPRWHVPLRTVRRVIVDEVHALAETKRGAHLALTLERLDRRAQRPLQRIGMSATVRPLEEAAAFLTGGRPCRVEHVKHGKQVALRAGLHHPDPLHASQERIEDALYARLDETISGSRSTLVFTNNRKGAEQMVLALRTRFGEKYGTAEDEEDQSTSLVAPHHGSMSKESRITVEERLKRGELKCVVTSTSLELGVHVDDVDEVVMLGSPKYVSRALQRVGRSGHHVGAHARGVMLSSEPDELAECVAIAGRVATRDVEPLRVPPGGLDVLAQHLTALAVDGTHTVEEALALTRSAWPYRALSEADLDATLCYLRDDARLIHHDGKRFGARSAAARITLARSGGAIPRAGLIRVLHGARFVGEVEEAFAEALNEGDIFQLAGEAWRFLGPAILSIHVEPARGKMPTVPEWRSEGLAASPAVLQDMRLLLQGQAPPEDAFEDDAARAYLADFVSMQANIAPLPREDELLVEHVRTDLGPRALVFHAMLGRRTTEALGRALAPLVDSFFDRVIAGETGFAIVGGSLRPSATALRALFTTPIEGLLSEGIEESEAFRRRFRHVAQRALILREAGRGRAQKRSGWYVKRWLDTAPDHPLLREARREVMQDAMDVAGAEAYRQRVAEGLVKIRYLPALPHATPYAACLLVPRGGPPGARTAALRDHFERWEEMRRPPRSKGEARNGPRGASLHADSSST